MATADTIMKCRHCLTRYNLGLAPAVRQWRCGRCRKVNGLPEDVRGLFGYLAHFNSQVAHGCAVAALAVIVGGGLGWALPVVSASLYDDRSVWAYGGIWALSVALAVAAVASFVAASRSAAGPLPRKRRHEWAVALCAMRRSRRSRLSLEVEEDDDLETEAQNLPWCPACDNLKPPRVHHCSTCSECVWELDHHCIFLHNCVGCANVKKFTRLLAAVAAGCWYVAIYAFSEVYASVIRGDAHLTAFHSNLGPMPRGSVLHSVHFGWAALFYALRTRTGALGALGALALGIAVAVSILAAHQIDLAAAGESQFERTARVDWNGPDYRTWPGLRSAFFDDPARRPAYKNDDDNATQLLLELLIDSAQDSSSSSSSSSSSHERGPSDPPETKSPGPASPSKDDQFRLNVQISPTGA